jgi:hypothetical protein
MTKILPLFILLSVAVNSNAQNRFEKGDWMVGAQSSGLDFKSRFNGGVQAKELNFDAMGGWFFADRFALEVTAGFDYLKARGMSTSDGAVTFGAGVRYYPVGNLFARFGYNGSVPTPSGDLRSYFGLKAGYDIFLARNVFLEPAVYFDKRVFFERNPGVDAGTENVLGLSLGLGVKF